MLTDKRIFARFGALQAVVLPNDGLPRYGVVVDSTEEAFLVAELSQDEPAESWPMVWTARASASLWLTPIEYDELLSMWSERLRKQAWRLVRAVESGAVYRGECGPIFPMRR